MLITDDVIEYIVSLCIPLFAIAIFKVIYNVVFYYGIKLGIMNKNVILYLFDHDIELFDFIMLKTTDRELFLIAAKKHKQLNLPDELLNDKEFNMKYIEKSYDYVGHMDDEFPEKLKKDSEFVFKYICEFMKHILKRRYVNEKLRYKINERLKDLPKFIKLYHKDFLDDIKIVGYDYFKQRPMNDKYLKVDLFDILFIYK